MFKRQHKRRNVRIYGIFEIAFMCGCYEKNINNIKLFYFCPILNDFHIKICIQNFQARFSVKITTF